MAIVPEDIPEEFEETGPHMEERIPPSFVRPRSWPRSQAEAEGMADDYEKNYENPDREEYLNYILGPYFQGLAEEHALEAERERDGDFLFDPDDPNPAPDPNAIGHELGPSYERTTSASTTLGGDSSMVTLGGDPAGLLDGGFQSGFDADPYDPQRLSESDWVMPGTFPELESKTVSPDWVNPGDGSMGPVTPQIMGPGAPGVYEGPTGTDPIGGNIYLGSPGSETNQSTAAGRRGETINLEGGSATNQSTRGQTMNLFAGAPVTGGGIMPVTGPGAPGPPPETDPNPAPWMPIVGGPPPPGIVGPPGPGPGPAPDPNPVPYPMPIVPPPGIVAKPTPIASPPKYKLPYQPGSPGIISLPSTPPPVTSPGGGHTGPVTFSSYVAMPGQMAVPGLLSNIAWPGKQTLAAQNSYPGWSGLPMGLFK